MLSLTSLVRPLLSLSISCLVLGVASAAQAQQEEEREPIRVIEPDKTVPKANAAAIDTEHFEIGVFTGMLAIDEFNSNPVFGGALRYYFNEKFLVEGTVGQSEIDRANPEGNSDFVNDRDITYFGVAGGYQLLRGRAFFGKKRKYNNGLYVLGGLEQFKFNDENATGATLGVSYKTVFTDYLLVQLDYRVHVTDREFNFIDQGDGTRSGPSKTAMDNEITIGISTFF